MMKGGRRSLAGPSLKSSSIVRVEDSSLPAILNIQRKSSLERQTGAMLATISGRHQMQVSPAKRIYLPKDAIIEHKNLYPQITSKYVSMRLGKSVNDTSSQEYI